MNRLPIEETHDDQREGRHRPGAYPHVIAFLLGALAGTQVTGLLFFLNPHLPFDPIPVLSGVGFYGLLLGTISFALTFPLLRRPGTRTDHWFPIGLTAVLTAAGLGAWIHASYFAFYLPPGINRRLLKAAIWLSLAAVICFYTAWIHRVRRRPYGHRSGILFGLMAVASIYVVMERREAFRPSLRPTPRPTTFQGSQRPQLYVVGIEAATLDAILPLEEQGRLPFFSKLLREGSYSRVISLHPTRREALWTTLTTGKNPFRHGIVGDRVYGAPFLTRNMMLNLLPLGVGFEHWGVRGEGEPIDGDARRVRALWEILSRLSIPTALVGWPLTSPSSAAQVVLSDSFFESQGQIEHPQPAELAERARLFHIQVDEIDPALASPFGSQPPEPVLQALAQDLWRKDLGLFLHEQDPQTEAFFLALPGLAEMSRRYFGGFSAVQFKGAQDPESEQASQLISAYYMFLDDLLGELWERLSDPRLLVVVSTRGAEGPQGWREARRLLLRKPAIEGYLDAGSDGVLMLLGEGVQAGIMPRPADLVDLVPTLLYGLGLPIARDLDGAVLTHAFETGFLARQPLIFLPSYETLTVSAAQEPP